MMPLSLAGAGDVVRVRKIGGNAETKKLKESRVAISREMANKIMV